MFLCRLRARRQIGLLLRNAPSVEKVQALFGVDTFPHGDTLDDAFSKLNPDQVQDVVSALTETLIRKKVLYPYRLFDHYFVVAIDGTGILSFSERHCPHCLTQTKNGKTLYYHNVLEAKLVTPNGFALSLMTEFIENPGENPKKQDCELKAFHRMAERLKNRFPRLAPHPLLRTIRLLGEHKGMEDLFRRQAPQVLETLRQVAIIQSTESSNRIEGIEAPPDRIKKLVEHKTTPKNRSEQEIAGYRDVLATIHANHSNIPFTPGIALQLHRDLYQFVAQQGGRWKMVDNEDYRDPCEWNPDRPFQARSCTSDSRGNGETALQLQEEVGSGRNRSAAAHPDLCARFLVHPSIHGRQWARGPVADSASPLPCRLRGRTVYHLRVPHFEHLNKI